MAVPLLGIGHAKLGRTYLYLRSGGVPLEEGELFLVANEFFIPVKICENFSPVAHHTNRQRGIIRRAATLTLTMQLSFCLPMMESEGNELCYISHPNHDRRIGCNIFGNLFLTNNWAGYVTHSFESLPQSFLRSHFLCLSSL